MLKFCRVDRKAFKINYIATLVVGDMGGCGKNEEEKKYINPRVDATMAWGV